jgi:hypothetical protein
MRALSAMAISATLLLAAPAAAAKLTMTCKNLRQEYVVVFGDKARTMILNPGGPQRTHYRVLAVEGPAARPTVTGLTVNDGSTFRAHFGGRKRMELFADNRLFQTDRFR